MSKKLKLLTKSETVFPTTLAKSKGQIFGEITKYETVFPTSLSKSKGQKFGEITKYVAEGERAHEDHTVNQYFLDRYLMKGHTIRSSRPVTKLLLLLLSYSSSC